MSYREGFMKRAILGGTLILAVSNSAAEPNSAYHITRSVELATNGTDPTVAVDSRTGTRLVAWTRPGQSSLEVVVARSGDDEDRHVTPVVVSAGDTDIVSSGVSPAQVASGPKGQVYVLYERRVPTPDFERGRAILRLARSTDGGRSFRAPVDVLAADGSETSAETANLDVAPDGKVVVAWLDSRDSFARAKLPEDQRPKDVRWLDSDDPKVEVRVARSTDGGMSFTPSVSIATGASEHSRVSLTIGPDGEYYAAWRAKLSQFKGSYDSVRDIVVASSSDGGATWSTPVKVHDDRFKAGSCPEITHGIRADSKGRLHVAWYTGPSIRPGVYYAVSTDRGKSFSAPLVLLTDAWVPYADVKLAVDGSDRAWVAFEDRRDDRNEQVVLTRIDPRAVPTRLGSWPGHAPDVAARAGTVRLVWTGVKGEIQTMRASSK